MFLVHAMRLARAGLLQIMAEPIHHPGSQILQIGGFMEVMLFMVLAPTPALAITVGPEHIGPGGVFCDIELKV